MGDLQSEEQRDILIEFKLPPVPAPGPDNIVSCQIVYFNVITSAMDTVECYLTLQRTSKQETGFTKKQNSSNSCIQKRKRASR